LRIASSLSAILGKPIHIRNIRAGRAQSGLRPQHLAGLELIRNLCAGQLTGGYVNSPEVWLVPGKLCGGGVAKADPGTAGWAQFVF
jgi:RNA 3'-terminal phosphate cyclase (ATP)